MSAAPVPIATIDGPSSSGKGTVSRLVAARVGWNLLDSGALYRLVALAGVLKGVDADDVAEHVALARDMRVQFGSEDGDEQVLLDGDDVTRRIRT
jgi:cytidylate kinase